MQRCISSLCNAINQLLQQLLSELQRMMYGSVSQVIDMQPDELAPLIITFLATSRGKTGNIVTLSCFLQSSLDIEDLFPVFDTVQFESPLLTDRHLKARQP